MLVSDQLPGRTLNSNQKEYLYFSGTSYLGVSKNEEFRECLLQGMKCYGTNYSSSRISNLRLKVFEEAEERLAVFAGAEASLTMSSGFLACQLLVHELKGKGRVFYAPETHPALWLTKEDFFQEDYGQWVKHLFDRFSGMEEKEAIIVSNALDALHAQEYDFSWLSQLPPNKNYTLVLDDSHGLGITGEHGGGIFSQIEPKPNLKVIVVSSLGKAMGIPGGGILSDHQTIQGLKKSAIFGGSSPIIPAYLYAFMHSEEIYSNERKKLLANVNQFGKAVAGWNLFQSFSRYPVFYTKENSLYPYLKEKGIWISSFPYPSPTDSPVTRIVINSLHTKEDVETLVKFVKEFKV